MLSLPYFSNFKTNKFKNLLFYANLKRFSSDFQNQVFYHNQFKSQKSTGIMFYKGCPNQKSIINQIPKQMKKL